MPRLTNTDYLINRHLLIEVWERHWAQLAELPTFAQRDLHRYYAMSKDLYDDQALAHRKEATKKEPSLPQQAGRAFAQLEAVMREADLRSQSPSPVAIPPGRRGKRRAMTIRVRALVRPEIDYKLIAEALLRQAIDDERKAASDQSQDAA